MDNPDILQLSAHGQWRFSCMFRGGADHPVLGTLHCVAVNVGAAAPRLLMLKSSANL